MATQFQHHLLNGLSFYHSVFLVPLSQLIDYINMCLFLGSIVCSTDLRVSLCQNHYCFDYYNFIIYIEIRKCDDSHFIIFSQNYFGYLGSFVIPCELYDSMFYL